HAAYEEDDAERPLAAAQCALCHEELDQGQPPGRRVAALFVDGRFQGARVTAMSDEVLFSHSTHVSSGLACTVCHQGIEESEAVDDTLAVEMATCVGCHERAGMPKEEECSVCHKELSPDRAPFNHAQAWKRRHGQTVRAEMGGAANDCRLCHSDQACTACHLDEKPASHNLYWHGRGHGIEAAMDRESCATCHQSDSCDRCHEEAEPLSHTGAWAGTLQTHCVSCHIPVQDESCFVCHQGTPSHELAPPLPSVPPHSPASDCRACHGVTTPLPHVDNGDNCVFCHN
ncbi:MAG TPA: cytochrome c3 family protein, partial [Planctomycetota bacterium]|nr:cytochrome c3 family protein [Planctomycetota bacterium]